MTTGIYTLRLQPSLRRAAERWAAPHNMSLDEFINGAIAERLLALETDNDARTKATARDQAAFAAFLDNAAYCPPAEGDERPKP